MEFPILSPINLELLPLVSGVMVYNKHSSGVEASYLILSDVKQCVKVSGSVKSSDNSVITAAMSK